MFEFIRPKVKTAAAPHARHPASFVTEHYAAWQLGLARHASLPTEADVPGIIAVGGGKGGVGKSIVSANLSWTLAKMGYRVLVLDLDLGCSNLHTHLGVSAPSLTLVDYLVKQRVGFHDVLAESSHPGLSFVASGREEEWRRFLDSDLKVMKPLWSDIFASRSRYDVDFVVIDLGAGTHRHTMDFFVAAHLGITTVLPEPTSIENAYVFLRMALWQLIENVGARIGEPEQAAAVQAALAETSAKAVGAGYLDCLRQMARPYPELIKSLARAMQGRYLGVVLNQARSQADMDIGQSMEHICQKYFGFQSRYLGYLNYDEAVWKSLRNRRHLMTDFPHSLIAKRLAVVANQAASLFGI